MEFVAVFLLIALPWLGDAFETERSRTKRHSDGFSKISWLHHVIVDNQYVKIPGMPKYPTRAHPSKYHELGYGKPDQAFDKCRTPRAEDGHCRYIQHCVLDDFANNFQVYFKYACFIQGAYVGVCCPESVQLSKKSCGVNNKHQTRRIGNRQTNANAFPWMAAVLLYGSVLCGGSLINERYVLTAAHCFDKVHHSQILVRLGEYRILHEHETKNSKDVGASAVKKHENYRNEHGKAINDIALITLDQPVDGNEFRPICLPPPGKSFAGDLATVIGWGVAEPEVDPPLRSDTLLEITIPVMRNSVCKDVLKYFKNEQLCAGERKRQKGSCYGDSGGPLMYEENKQWFVIGVVSWGQELCNGIGAYVRVTEYLNWIDHNTR